MYFEITYVSFPSGAKQMPKNYNYVIAEIFNFKSISLLLMPDHLSFDDFFM